MPVLYTKTLTEIGGLLQRKEDSCEEAVRASLDRGAYAGLMPDTFR